MSSKIVVQRVCQFCFQTFSARTTVTKYCSRTCTSKAYKAAKRDNKVAKSNTETRAVKQPKYELIKLKEYLTVTEAAALLSSSRQTIYNLIHDGKIKASNIKVKKTLISRREIDKLLGPEIVPAIPKIEEVLKVESCYYVGEIEQKYGISGSGLNLLIKKHNIPKLKMGKHTYVPKAKIDQLLNPSNSKT